MKITGQKVFVANASRLLPVPPNDGWIEPAVTPGKSVALVPPVT